MVVNNWNVGTQSNMLGAVYWINQLPLDLPTQTASKNIPSAKWETTSVSFSQWPRQIVCK